MNAELFDVYGIDVSQVMDNGTGEFYLVMMDSEKKFITSLKYGMYIAADDFWTREAEKVKTLLYNKIPFEEKVYKSESEFLEFLNNNYINNSPQEKLDLLLEYFAGLMKYDGQSKSYSIPDYLDKRQIWRKFYFVNKEEFIFYVRNLKSQNLITYEEDRLQFVNLTLTLSGLTRLARIKERKYSKSCFIAMSFSNELLPILNEAILPALEETNFKPIIVSQVDVPADKTINDAIIAGIKKARFTIAEFTEHKAGVYFEAGYALGRGQKVIYTCRESDIKNAHFDTRNFQHILWKTTNELKKKLIDKINAYIMD